MVPNYTKPSTAVSIAAWVNPSELDYDATIVKNWGDGTTLSGSDVLGQFNLGLSSTTGKLSGLMPETQSGTGVAQVINSSSALPTSTWTHVAMVYSPPTGANLVTNGDFSDGLNNWVSSGTVSVTSSVAQFGAGSVSGNNEIEATVSTTAGETYLLSFNYRDDSSDYNQAMRVEVDGDAALMPPTDILSEIAATEYINYQYQFTADSSSTTSKFTDFSDTAGTTNNGSIGVDGYLDDVTVINASNGTLKLYENGTEVSSASLNYLKSSPVVTSLGIGVRLNDAQNGPAWDMSFWNGLIDDLAIWNRSISLDEIEALNQLGNNSMGLVDVAPGLAPQSINYVEVADPDTGVIRNVPVRSVNQTIAPPVITIEQDKDFVTLRWPAGYTLQSSDVLDGEGWQTVHPGDGSDMNKFRYELSDEKANAIQFFRLTPKIDK